MARQIKETPILKGKDAVAFLDSQKNAKKTISKGELERINDNYSKLLALVDA